MTNAYPFLPNTLKSVFIVLFDSNGPDLNLLDPFHFKFHRCALKAEYQALSYKFGTLWSTVCVGKSQSNEWRQPGDGSVAPCWIDLIRNTKSVWVRMVCAMLFEFFLHFETKLKQALLSTSKDTNNCKINERADRQENLGELHLDVAQVMWWRTKPPHLFIHMMQFSHLFKTGKMEHSLPSQDLLLSCPLARLLILCSFSEYISGCFSYWWVYHCYAMPCPTTAHCK